MSQPNLRLKYWSNLSAKQRRVILRYLKLSLIIIIAAFCIEQRAFLTPEVIFILLFVIFLVYGQANEFVRRFLPFLALLISYDALRSFIPFVSHRVHYTAMINFDRWLAAGHLPTALLQQWLYHGHLQWYDFYFYALYVLHFVTPILVAVLIWKTRPKSYWPYVWSFVVLSYAGFITYLLFPAAPPWLAAQNGFIAPIEKISTDVWWAMGVHNFPSLYEKFSPNLVAAVPSLHAAYPTLVALFIWQLYGKKWGLLTLLYACSVWVGVVYMGEHYVFDVILGIIYAIGAFLAVRAFYKWYSNRGKPKLANKKD